MNVVRGKRLLPDEGRNMKWINRIFRWVDFFHSFFSFSVSHAFDAEFSSNNQQKNEKKKQENQRENLRPKILKRLFTYKTV